MTITKKEYVLRCLTKIAHKKWEFFVVSRIIHGLSDDEIEFITQQLVRRPDGTRALTDLYFPQFGMHLEIDEPFHHSKYKEDFSREQDIVRATDHSIKRIKITNDHGEEKDLASIRSDVDKFIGEIKNLKHGQINKKDFIPWDFDAQFMAETYIKRGHISIDGNVVFRNQVEAMKCFGFQGRGWQRGAWKICDETHDEVWFPRLYEHGMWKNELSADGKTIYEEAINDDGKNSIEKQKKDWAKHPNRKFIVFAKAKDSLGVSLLRYVGSFRANLSQSRDDKLVFERVATEEKVRVDNMHLNSEN